MAFVFHSRQLGIPLWALAFFAVALRASPSLMPSLVGVVALGVMAFATFTFVRWLQTRASSDHRY